MDRSIRCARVAVVGGCGGMGRVLVQALLETGVDVAVLDLPASLAENPVPSGALALEIDGSDASFAFLLTPVAASAGTTFVGSMSGLGVAGPSSTCAPLAFGGSIDPVLNVTSS